MFLQKPDNVLHIASVFVHFVSVHLSLFVQTVKFTIPNISRVETNEDAGKAFDLFVKTYGERCYKANAYLSKYVEEILAFFDFRYLIYKAFVPLVDKNTLCHHSLQHQALSGSVNCDVEYCS